MYHEYAGRPGYRIMTVYLNRRGTRISRTTTLKYMREMGIRSVVHARRYRYKKGDCYKKFDNLLKRDFRAEKPNEKWCADFTYIFLSDGARRYNCSIVDLYDRSVVSSINGKRIDADLAVETLKKALRNNPSAVGKVILHSDQGSQFTSQAFTEYCEKRRVTQSMSRAGCPYDNAPMESYYGTFKAELIEQHSFEDDRQLDNAVAEYVYCYYNRIRPHSANGYLTPFEKRNMEIA